MFLSPGDAEGAKELLIFLLEIDLEKVVLIPIPEEIVEFVDQVPDFPSGLDFLFVLSSFSPPRLAFEVFDFEDHLGGDGAFLVEHGVGEGLLDDGADFSGDAERDLMDGFEGMLVEDRFFGAGQFEVMDAT